MSWQPEVDEITRRRALAAKMGGPEGIARQRKRGKLTVRERIDRIGDPGTFREFMGLAGHARYEGNELQDFTPKGSVEGIAELDGRKVVVSAGDFTVRGGSGSATSGDLGQEMKASQRALEWRVPFVRLLDSAGGSVKGFEDIGRTYLPDGNTWSWIDARHLNTVPVVSAVMGSVAGLPAVNACMAHFNLMVKGKSQLFPGGPPVVKAALGYDITKEELGDERVHVGISGSVDNLAEDEDHAFELIRQFLSYLPSNVHELPPRVAPTDDRHRADEELLSIVPRNDRRAYSSHKLINHVVDKDSFFEIAPAYGRSRITGLARVNGYSVGVMANNTKFHGGSTDVAAGDKVIRLLQLCETFHLPIVSFADEPGFMVGLDSEKKGIERAGARLVWTTCESRMPWITFVTGKVYGVAGQCQHRATGMFRRYAWPSGNWGSMHIAGGTTAAYRREIDEAPDPDPKRREIEGRLNALASPFRTAEATGQDIIDPRESRSLLCDFIDEAQSVLATQLGPSPYLPYRP